MSMHQWIKQLKHFWHTLDRKRKIQLGAILFLLVAIPTTVYVAQIQQEIRQRAQESTLLLAVTPEVFTPGSIVTVSWNGGQASATAALTETIQLQASPSSIPRGGEITASWVYKDKSITPNPYDILEVFTSSGDHVAYLYLNSCTNSAQEASPSASGHCTINTTNYGPTTYIIKSFRHTSRKRPLSQTTFTVTDPQQITPTQPVVTSGGSTNTAPVSIEQARCSGKPADFCTTTFGAGSTCGAENICTVPNSLYTKTVGEACNEREWWGTSPGYCKTGLVCGITNRCMEKNTAPNGQSCQDNSECSSNYCLFGRTTTGVCTTPQSTHGDNSGENSGFLFIPKAFAQTGPTLKGDETIQLFKANSWDAAGRQIYLNCEEKTPDTPPSTTPIQAGACEYPISPDIPLGAYTFRMYTPEGKLVGESPILTITKELPTSSITPTGTIQQGTSCMSDTDCTNSGSNMKCFRYETVGGYTGTCRPADTQCAQVVTRACGQRQPNCNSSGGCTNVYFPPECTDFPNPCVVPPGWELQSATRGQACRGPQDTSCGSERTCLQECPGPAIQGREQPAGYFCATAAQVAARELSGCPI